MNLGSLTQDQRDCVTHVRGPLLVSAGAGSGKTLMLTKRIVYALLHPEESGVRDIDEVLAITFTDLAASEIKARVRNGLREEGLTEAALKVDASWISTIHGMCSRILHECALDLGLDPRFGLLDETDRAQLLEDCVNEALEQAGAAGGGDEAGAAALPGFRELFAEYEKADSASSVGEMVRRLVDTAANVRGGLDAVTCAEVPAPQDIAGDVLRAMVACEAAARTGIAKSGKQKETFTEKALDVFMGEHGTAAFERLAAKRGCSYAEVALGLANVDLSFGSRTKKEPFATAYALFKNACFEARCACALGLALPARTELLELARRVQGLFDAAKAQRGVLDQNDLLVKTLEAFETRPDIEARYRDRFKLVMVDEFQDTSGLQVALIAHLTDGDRRLCTVGDTQQSIYRFRGADVETYRAHKREMRRHETDGLGGLYRELGKNFRSHGDIIAFVNRVFGAPEVFGSGGEFIELDWVADHAASNPFPDVPRIDVVAVTSRKMGGVGTDDRHLVEAEAIARRLEALHADAPNRRWGDMVVLLGTIKRAEVYARTLRAHGIPCIVSGGSGFAWTFEAQEVGALLGAMADPWDDANLRAALSGAAFGLGAEELLRLGTADDGNARHLWEGLLAQREGDPSPRVRLAAALLSDAVAHAGARGAARALTELVVSSGWLDRLQDGSAQGMAGAANVLKAIRLVESVEDDPGNPRGVASTAVRVARKLAEGLKEKPGVLTTADQDAVRVLTIHASKGLEFPIVALADFYGMHAETRRLRLETAGERVYLSLLPSASIADGTPLENFLDSKFKLTATQRDRLVEAGYLDLLEPPELDDTGDFLKDAVGFHHAVGNHARKEDLGELRRKFYVGATRPREALIVAVEADEAGRLSPGQERLYGDALEDLRRGLFGPFGDFATAPEGIDFGGQRRASAERIRLTRDDAGALLVDGAPVGDYVRPEMLDAGGVAEAGATEDAGATARMPTRVPEVPRPGERLSDILPGKRPCNPLRAGAFSYSRLAAGAAHGDGEGAENATDPDELYLPTPETWEGDDRDAPDVAELSMHGTGAGASGIGTAETSRQSDGAADRGGTSPVAFGSALHQVCQFMVEQLRAARDAGNGDAALEPPSSQRLAACLRTWDVPAERLPALEEAVRLWAASDAAAEASAHPDLCAEAPIYATLQGPQGEPIHLEGSIDLLCFDHRRPAQDQAAFVVDYKTGGTPTETPEQLQAKHKLQAMCYSYAVLQRGYAAVDLAFVRVQQLDAAHPGQPQTVRYHFEHGQLQELAERIREEYARAVAR